MKTFSKLALAAALLGSASLTAAPALAKKEEAKPGTGLKLSPDVLKVAQPAQTAIAAKDYATAEPLVAQVEAAAKSDDDKYIAAALRFDLEKGKLYGTQDAHPGAPVNETALAAPLDVLLANPKTPAENRPKYAYMRGSLAFNSKQYPQAIQYLQQAKQLGNTDPNLDLLLVKAKMESGDVAGGTADLDSAIARMNAAGQKAPEDYYRYAISRATAVKNKQATLSWLAKYGAAYPTAKNWRDIAVIYGLQGQSIDTLDKAQKLDLYRLMHDSHALADQYDYEEYAQSAIDRGLPSEAQMVLREGQASGKLASGNRTVTELMTQANAAAKAEGSLASLDARARTSADGKLASQTADAYLNQGNNAKAADLYRVALSKGGVDADTVNTHLGIALSRSGDKAGAQAAFAAVHGAPRSNIATLWSAWLNASA